MSEEYICSIQKKGGYRYSHPTSRVVRLAGKGIQKVKTGLALKNVGSNPMPPISTIVLQNIKRKEEKVWHEYQWSQGLSQQQKQL